MGILARRGLIVWAASSLRQGRGVRRIIGLSSAKNEYESFEIVVAPDDGHTPLKGVELEYEDLVSQKGRIGKEKIRCYVKGGIGSDVLFAYDSFWSIMARQRVTSAQSFWVTVYVPADAKAGTYKGKVRVTTKNAGSMDIGLRLRIWDFRLPTRMHLKTHFMMKYGELRGLYPNLSDALFEETLFRFWVDMAEHRVSGQGNVAFPFRIVRGKRVLPKYSRFDGDMSILINLGLNVYCLHLFDIEPHINPRTFTNVLSRLQSHLGKRRWLDLACLHLEKGCHRLTLASQAKLAKRASPEIKVVAEVGDSRELRGQQNLIDIWIIDCCRSRPKDLAGLLRGGSEVWLDGACRDGRHGPLCRHHEQVDVRRTFWRMWSMGMRGLVYDLALPTKRSKEPLIYTWEEGVLNSIRLEIIRDGIEDYEYLSLLEGIVGNPKGTGRSMARIQRRAIRLLRGIRSKGGHVNMAQAREEVAAILEDFSARAPRKVNIPSSGHMKWTKNEGLPNRNSNRDQKNSFIA